MLGVLTTLLVLLIFVGVATGLLLLGRALVLTLAERPVQEMRGRGPFVATPYGYEASQAAGAILRQTVGKIAQKVLPRR